MSGFISSLIGLATMLITLGILILITGCIHNRKGYVSIIEKKKEFHCIEIRKFAWYFPLVYRKVMSIPTIESKRKRRSDGAIITFQVTNIMKLYESRRSIKDIINEGEDVKIDFEKYGIKLIDIK